MASIAAGDKGQRHDRIPKQLGFNNAPVGSEDPAPPPLDSDITLAQKMLCAVSGSILTSLLGKLEASPTSPFNCSRWLWLNVT